MEIDIVIPWVDGNDPEWQKEKVKYQSTKTDDGNSVNRFRDWGLLPFWFRAVEKYLPWVRKIHFVTWGHIPEFLNINHPKLNVVNHADYIPDEYRPTFSANTIELNFWRIPDLAEHFIYFNDDMFVLKEMKPDDFFISNKPCTCGMEEPFSSIGEDGIWRHLIINDLRIINNHFDKHTQIKKNSKLYINKKYGIKTNLRTLLLQIMYPNIFLGFRNLHAPAAFCKSTFEELWNKEFKILNRTCLNKFRTSDDVNQWLAIWWQIAKGDFVPRIVDNMVEDTTNENIQNICSVISKKKHEMICVNDPSPEVDFYIIRSKLFAAFSSILPDRSSFEKEN